MEAGRPDPLDEEVADRLSRFSGRAGLFCCAVGIAMLAGATGPAGVAGWSILQAASAAGLFLAGLALARVRGESAARRAAPAGACRVLGGLTLVAGVQALRGLEPSALSPLACVTPGSILLAGYAVLLLARRAPFQALMAQALAAAIGLANLAVFLAHAHGVEASAAPMHGALAYLMLAGGLLAAVPDLGPMRLVSSRAAGGALARRLLPTALAVPVVLGGLQLAGRRAELYSAGTGDLLTTLAMATLLGTVVWNNARVLQQADLMRLAADAELADARDQALDALRAKSDSLANISHELRTPMGGVLGMLDILLDAPLPPAQRQCATTARRCAASLLDLVDGVLDLSRLEAGKLELEHERFDLRRLMEDAVELTALPAQQKGLEVVLQEVPGTPRLVRGDALRVRQVITNLLGNAIKFTERGRVVITAEPVPVPELAPRRRVRIAVTDTGVGITPPQLERLFRKFVQADSSTTRRFGGSGLGLAISRQLVRLMGGQIGASSQPGRGSIFWFTLDVEGAAPEPAAALAPTGTQALLVYADPVGRNVLLEIMQAAGLAVAVAEDAAAARAWLAGGAAPRVAVLERDPDAPAVDALARELDGRVIMITSLAGRVRAATADPRVGWLVKPLRPSLVEEALASALAPASDDCPAIAEVAPSAPAPTRRVLVVEDTAFNRDIAAHLLGKLGGVVEFALHGQEALELLERRAYDVVYMDCQMPVMDGYEATRLLRARERGRRTPVVGMTAHAMVGDRERCLESGMDDYITKPLLVEAFRETLSRWAGPLDLATASVTSPASAPAPAPDAPLPVLDRALIMRLDARGRSGSGSFLERVGDMFLRSVEAHLDTLRAAADAGDAAAIQRVAHALKGTSINLGARRLHAVTVELESTARQSPAGDAVAVIQRLDAELASVREALYGLRSG